MVKMIVCMLLWAFLTRFAASSVVNPSQDPDEYIYSTSMGDDGTAVFDSGEYDEDTDLKEQEDQSANFCDLCTCSNQTDTIILVDCNPGHHTGGIYFVPNWAGDIDQNVSMLMDLSYNEIREIIKFPSLPVINLDISHNDLRSIRESALVGISSTIQKLDLSNNKLDADSVDKESFTGALDNNGKLIFSVVELSLARNRLHTVEPDFFDYMTYLTILDLSDNPLAPLTQDVVEAINRITNLETLSLRQANLEYLPEGFLSSLDRITYLDLAGNRFPQVDPQLRQIPSLESLNLNANLLKTLDSSSFENLSRLKNLSVSDCPNLKYVDQFTFKDQCDLHFLRLKDNVELSWISPDAWPTDTNMTTDLVELDLSNNALPYLPNTLLHSYSDWKNIEIINIQGNPWMCDCHSDWMMYHLVPLIHRNRPELTQDILCAGPKKSHLIKEEIMVVIQLMNETDLDCTHREFSFYQKNFNIEENDLQEPRPRKQMLPLALTIICVIAIMGTTLMVGYLYLEKKKVLSLRIRRPQRDNPAPRVAYFPANFGRHGYARHHDDTVTTSYTDLPPPTSTTTTDTQEVREMDSVTAPRTTKSSPSSQTTTSNGVANSNFDNNMEYF